MQDNLNEYLQFEGAYTQKELEAFEESSSEEDRAAVLRKRRDAAGLWKIMGRELPLHVTFAE
jgi:hypothetical protein